MYSFLKKKKKSNYLTVYVCNNMHYYIFIKVNVFDRNPFLPCM